MRFSVARYTPEEYGGAVLKEEGSHEQYWPRITLLDKEQVDVCVEALNKLDEEREKQLKLKRLQWN